MALCHFPDGNLRPKVGEPWRHGRHQLEMSPFWATGVGSTEVGGWVSPRPSRSLQGPGGSLCLPPLTFCSLPGLGGCSCCGL